jgi:hypothetical protein
MEKIMWSDNVNNVDVIAIIGEKRMLLDKILRRKVNWVGHIVRIYCVLYDVSLKQMTEVKGVGKELLGDFRN